MNKNTTSIFIGAAASLVPYLLVAWAYMALVEGTSEDFWSAIGVLVAGRLFFAIIEAVGAWLAWHASGKRRATSLFLDWLRSNNFPKREYVTDDMTNYLARLEGDEAVSADVRCAVKQMNVALMIHEEQSILGGMRMHKASNLALDLHSPNTKR